MRFLRIAGALLLIAILCEAVLIISGTPGHSFNNGRAIMEALGSALQLFGIAIFGAVIAYPTSRLLHIYSPTGAAVRTTVLCGLLIAAWAFHEWFSGGYALWPFP